MSLLNRDMRDYAPVDALKGIDLRTGKIVNADDKVEGKVDAVRKCKNCKNYKASDDFNGSCYGDDSGYYAYGDMNAETCDMFV